jgi:hypothetical protein
MAELTAAGSVSNEKKPGGKSEADILAAARSRLDMAISGGKEYVVMREPHILGVLE